MTTEHSKPTPGPWEAHTSPYLKFPTVTFGDVSIEIKTGAADAHLIASAPDMLAALQQCAAALRQCNHIPGVTEQAIWAADAAISKVLGDTA